MNLLLSIMSQDGKNLNKLFFKEKNVFFFLLLFQIKIQMRCINLFGVFILF